MRARWAMAAALALAGCGASRQAAENCALPPEALELRAVCAGEAQALSSFAVEKAAPAARQSALAARAATLTDLAQACRGPGAAPDRGLVTGFATEAEIAQERAIARARDARLAALRARYGWITRGDLPSEAFGPEQPACAAIGGAP